MTPDCRFRLADYADPEDARVLVELLGAYARDPMGGGEPLGDYARTHLVGALAQWPHAFSVLGFCEEVPVALANCFVGLSTFACRPLVNIHDFAVLAPWRGRGIAQALMGFVEAQARQRNACKMTLEVLEGNEAANRFYRQWGFADYQLDPQMGNAQFLQKYL